MSALTIPDLSTVSSWPGLTPASIHLQETLDCRVKPGNDSTVDNSPITRADFRPSRRYINLARHVRAFGVGMDLGK